MATTLAKERMILADEQARDEVVSLLQACLVDLIDLSMQCKQAHWNLVGRRFHSFHRQLDEIVETAREGADDVAERIATLGTWADGRSSTVSSQSNLEAFPEDRLDVEQAVTLVADRLHTTIGVMRNAIHQTGETDPVTQDLLLDVCGRLEKHLWMVQVQEEQ